MEGGAVCQDRAERVGEGVGRGGRSCSAVLCCEPRVYVGQEGEGDAAAKTLEGAGVTGAASEK